jgi:hypothetical protein
MTTTTAASPSPTARVLRAAAIIGPGLAVALSLCFAPAPSFAAAATVRGQTGPSKSEPVRGDGKSVHSRAVSIIPDEIGRRGFDMSEAHSHSTLQPLVALTFGERAVGERSFALIGDATPATVGGRRVLQVDDGCARLGRLHELVGADALTVAFDFNRRDAVGGATRLFWHHGNCGVAITDDRYVVTLFGEDGQAFSLRSKRMPIDDGAWQSVALALDPQSGAVRLHVDGAVVVSADGADFAFSATARGALFGGAPVAGAGFSGLVDDLRIFAGAMTPDRLPPAEPADAAVIPLAPAPDAALAAPGAATLIDVLSNDAGEGTLRLLSARSAEGGSASLIDGAIEYRPAPGFFGDEVVTYVVADATGATAEAAVAVTVAIVVRDAVELGAALEAAKGGELILLAPGDYGGLSLDGRASAHLAYGAEVTLRSLEPDRMARVTGLDLHSVRNLTFEAIHFDYVAAPEAIDAVKPFTVTNAAAVTIRDSVFEGALAETVDPTRAGFGTGHGLTVRGSRDVTVDGNTFFHWHRGAVFGESSGLAVTGNLVHSVRSDGFDFAGVQDVRIVDNAFRDFRASRETGDHADMIQFWTNGQTTPNVDILIARNVLDSGAGDYTQSIFMRNEEVDNGRAGREMFYRNVRIEDNLIRNAHLHGITVGETDGLVIAGNTVAHSEATASGASVTVPRINVASSSVNVTVSRNLAAATPAATGSGWLVSDNLLIQRDRPDAAGYYGDVFADGLADHRPAAEALRVLPGHDGLGSPLARVGAGHVEPYAYITAAAGEGLNRGAIEFRIGGVFDQSGPVASSGASVLWDFGDGGTTAAPAVRHGFASAGNHDVKAVVILADGRRVEAHRTVEAESPVALYATFEDGFADLGDHPNQVSAGAGVTLVASDGDRAARLPGGSDTIAFARSADLIGNAGYTVLLDFMKENPTQGGRLVYFASSFVVTLGADSIRVDLTTDAGAKRLDYRSAALADADWRHLALVFDGDAGSATLFLDGAAVARAVGVGALQAGSASHDLHLGGPFGGGFAGLVDNFAFLGGAMTAEQVAAYVAAARPQDPAEFVFDPPDLALSAPVDPW